MRRSSPLDLLIVDPVTDVNDLWCLISCLCRLDEAHEELHSLFRPRSTKTGQLKDQFTIYMFELRSHGTKQQASKKRHKAATSAAAAAAAAGGSGEGAREGAMEVDGERLDAEAGWGLRPSGVAGWGQDEGPRRWLTSAVRCILLYMRVSGGVVVERIGPHIIMHDHPVWSSSSAQLACCFVTGATDRYCQLLVTTLCALQR